jgi:hypothetical protein
MSTMDRPAFRFSNYQKDLLMFSLKLFYDYDQMFWPPREKWLRLPGMPDYDIERVKQPVGYRVTIVFHKPVEIDGEVNTRFRFLPEGGIVLKINKDFENN